MKYRVGDKIKIKNREWYNSNSDESGNINCNDLSFVKGMRTFLGRVVTIDHIDDGNKYFSIVEDTDNQFSFNDEMVETLESRYIDSIPIDEIIESLRERGYTGNLKHTIVEEFTV